MEARTRASGSCRLHFGPLQPYCSAFFTEETRKAYHIVWRNQVSPFVCTITSIPRPPYWFIYSLIRRITDKLSGNLVIPIRNIRLFSSVSIVTMLHVGQPLVQGTSLTEHPPCLSYSEETGVKWTQREAHRSPRINVEVRNAWDCISTPPIRLDLLRWHKLPFVFQSTVSAIILNATNWRGCCNRDQYTVKNAVPSIVGCPLEDVATDRVSGHPAWYLAPDL